MNSAELSKRALVFRDATLMSTLRQTSARKPDDANDCQMEPYAFDSQYSSSGIACLDFDALKLALYPPCPRAMTPCSADALIFEHNGTFLIEFKFLKTEIENITRKAYDSVMLMIEHGGYTFDQSRKEISYLVVSTGIVNRMDDKHRALWRGLAYCREPWKKFRNSDDHWKVASLEGVIVKEAYCMHPATFDYYVKLKHWV